MTMSNVVMSSPQRTGASLRKTNKPLMEKRRRARINDSLTQLKSLVIQSTKKDSSQFNKLEKADILELTVKHLRTLQEQQLSQVSEVSSAGKYQAGFMECANEVIRYLGQSQGFTDDLKSRVVHHLAGCIQLSNKLTFAKPVQSSSPVTTPPTMPAGPKNNAQIINGQIVQVVNGHFPSVKPAIVGSFAGGVPVSIAPLTSAASSPARVPASITSATTTTTTPSSEAPSFLKYSQPLQIQIPTVVSPIIIRANTGQLPPDRSSLMYKIQDVPEHGVKVQDLPSHINTQMTHPRQETFAPSQLSPPCRERSTSSHPSPPCRERSTSPVPLVTCRNSQFYTHDSQYADFMPRSRTYSLTSSSSETELMSPLNLSQSPKYYDHRELSAQNPGSLCTQLSQTPIHSNTISSAHPTTKHRLLLPISPSSNLTSVIVDGRKTSDSHFMKYMHYIDDDRHFVRYEGSTSPASSVGEDRLWRPW